MKFQFPELCTLVGAQTERLQLWRLKEMRCEGCSNLPSG